MTDHYAVYVVDDDPGVRNSLRFLLANEGRRVSSFESGEDFLERHDDLEPGVLLLDACLDGMSGIDVLHDLHVRGSHMQTIMITGHGDIAMAVEAMKCGAVDFLTKPFAREDLLVVLKQIDGRKGHDLAHEELRQSSMLRLNVLTPREHEVLNELARGLPNKSIGYDLGISARTVEIHRANLMRKLEVQNLAEALRIAFNAGMPLSKEDLLERNGQKSLPLDGDDDDSGHIEMRSIRH